MNLRQSDFNYFCNEQQWQEIDGKKIFGWTVERYSHCLLELYPSEAPYWIYCGDFNTKQAALDWIDEVIASRVDEATNDN